MRIPAIIFILVVTCLYSCQQTDKSSADKASMDLGIMDSANIKNHQSTTVEDIAKYLYSDTLYTTSSGKGITIQNSLPKGGMLEPDGTQYADKSGKTYAIVVFWTRIVNETDSPIEISINFPADSLAIFSSPASYVKLFLPSDKATFDKLASFNYGITGLKSFLDSNMHRETRLKKKIMPNEESIFYVATLSYEAAGKARGAFFLQDQELFYRMSVMPHGSGTIPSGEIKFVKESVK